MSKIEESAYKDVLITRRHIFASSRIFVKKFHKRRFPISSFVFKQSTAVVLVLVDPFKDFLVCLSHVIASSVHTMEEI